MKLHVRNMAATAGAIGDEIDEVAAMVNAKGERVTMEAVEKALQEIRS